MEPFKRKLAHAVSSMGADSKTVNTRIRAAEVRREYADIIHTMYGPSADLFLDHTNGVYILSEEGVRKLIVYVDESIFAADLNAQRELIVLRFHEKFHEDIEAFDIHVSYGDYKNRHPYRNSASDPTDRKPSVPLTAEEEKRVDEAVKDVGDERLRAALRKAMKTDLEWKKDNSREI